MSSAVQELFNLTQSHLFAFAFIAFVFGVKSKKKKIITKTDIKELSTYVFF